MLQVCNSLATLLSRTVSIKTLQTAKALISRSIIVSPQVFKSVGAGSNALFFSGFFGVAKVISCFLFLSFFVERIGRKGALAIGAALMGALFLIVAVLTVTHPPKPNGGISSTSVASLVMIYLEASKSPDKPLSSCSLGD